VTAGADERVLLQRCLSHDAGAWNDFVDRYLSLIYRVVHFTAHHRSATVRPEDVEDIAAETLLQIVANNYAVLRQFQGKSSLRTYLTVIARRICVHQLARRQQAVKVKSAGDAKHVTEPPAPASPDASLETLEEVHQMLARLPKRIRDVVRLFYLEGRKYEDISAKLRIPVNSIGPILTRAKQVLRRRMQARLAAKTSPPPPAARKAGTKQA
jgi:RNA polymerase sigma-70 factor (ECF subfamily)